MYKEILVHVDNSEACPARLRTAVALARRHGAKLQGRCVVPELNLAVYGGAPVPAEIVDEQVRMLEQDLARAQELFQEAVAGSGISSECAAEQGPVGQRVAMAARYADLVVVGKPDPDDPRCTAAGVAVTVAFSAGVPVAITPPASSFESLGSRVAIAWNGSREAQRAVRDALGLLVHAAHVDVLCVVDSDGLVGGQEDAAQHLCRHLAAHGIKADPHYVNADVVDEGGTLLARCADLGADLLVIGAYGHSRVREFFLGGVTRSVLSDHTIPILLSH